MQIQIRINKVFESGSTTELEKIREEVFKI
jgi:hypothetical protein